MQIVRTEYEDENQYLLDWSSVNHLIQDALEEVMYELREDLKKAMKPKLKKKLMEMLEDPEFMKETATKITS